MPKILQVEKICIQKKIVTHQSTNFLLTHLLRCILIEEKLLYKKYLRITSLVEKGCTNYYKLSNFKSKADHFDSELFSIGHFARL